MADPAGSRWSGAESAIAPVLHELPNCFFGDPSYVDSCSDADIYRGISTAVTSQRAPGSEGLPEPARQLIEEKVQRRLRRGWFNGAALTSPQSRYAVEAPELGAVTLESDERNPVVAAKPWQAVWTGSLLPDGSSSLDVASAAVPRKRDKRMYLIEFDPADVRVRLIDGVEDWRHLVNDYPVDCSDGTVGVSWTAVSCDYDVVRLSARGLVYCQDRPVRVDSGMSVLRHWDAESAAWFRFPPGAEVVPAG